MSRVKTTQFISLLGILLLGACSSVERGVVVGKGHSLRSTPTMPTDYYWVDVRGKNADGERVTERIGLFKRDWERFHDGDAISPHDFDLIGATKSLRSSLDKIARIGGKPKPEPARTKTAQSRVPASRKSPPQTPSAKVRC